MYNDLVIIAGGKGARISKHVSNKPKLLLDLDKQTVLEKIIRGISHRNLYLSLGHLSEKVLSFVEAKGLAINYYLEKDPLGSFGGLKALTKHYYNELSDQIVVILGDVYLSNLDFTLSLASDNNLLVYSKNDHPHDSDRIIIEKNKRISRLIKKNENYTGPFSNLTVSGIYVFNKNDILASPFEKGDISGNFVPFLIENNCLNAVRNRAVVKDVGTIDRLLAMSNFDKLEPAAINLNSSRRAVFMDLDGTVINDRGSKPYKELDKLELKQVTAEIIKECNRRFIPVLIVTNQGDIAKGFKTFKDFYDDINFIEEKLSHNGAWIDDVYFCPHHPKRGFVGEVKKLKINCNCRKPNIDLARQAAIEWNISLSHSVMVGDTDFDKNFAKEAQLTAYFDINSKTDIELFLNNIDAPVFYEV